MTSSNPKFIPLFINVENLRVLVIGGGMVGTKRALMFRDARAKVTVAAREFSEELKSRHDIDLITINLPKDMEVLKEIIMKHDIVVVALSDEDLAKRISSMVLAMGKLVNNTVNHSDGNVIVPFRGEAQGLHIAVTSMGATGLAARIALNKAIKMIDSDIEVKAIIKAMGKLKALIREKVRDHKVRMSIYDSIANDVEFRSLASKGEWAAAYLRGLKIIESYNIPLNPSYYQISDSS